MSDSDLIEYALGTLNPSETERLNRKLATDPLLRAELEEIQNALNGIVEEENPVKPPMALRNRILSSMHIENQSAGFVDRLCAMFQLSAKQIQDILSNINNIGNKPWEQLEIPGIQLLHFDGGPKVATADCGLVYIEPGTTFPNHEHGGDEWSLVLQGEVESNDEKIYYPGDFVHFGPGSKHYVRAIGDEPVILAVALFGGFEFIK